MQMLASFIFALTAVLPLSRLHACVGASRARSLFAPNLRPSSGYALPRIILSLFLALQLSLAGAVPSHAHVNGELAGGSADGAASIKTVTSADASKYGLQKSSGSNTLYDPVTQINYAVGKDGLIYEVSSLSDFNPIPLSKPLTSAPNRVVSFDGVTTAAANRLGFDPADVRINNGVADVPIIFTETIRTADLNAVASALGSQGATTARVNAGSVINSDLSSLLGRLADRGRTFRGFNVTRTGDPNNMFILERPL